MANQLSALLTTNSLDDIKEYKTDRSCMAVADQVALHLAVWGKRHLAVDTLVQQDLKTQHTQTNVGEYKQSNAAERIIQSKINSLT